jgi:hypothetical protein
MTDSHHHAHTPIGGESRGHEPTDVGIRPFVIVGIGLIIAAIIGNLVLLGFYVTSTNRLQARQPQPGPLARTTQVPPAPRLQVSPRQDLQTMLADHNRRLNGYGWVDRNAGTAHIPIERAMDLVVQQGLPARTGGPALEQSPDLQESDDLDSEGGQPPQNDAQSQPGNEP